MEKQFTREEILDYYAKGGRSLVNGKAEGIDLSNTNLEGMSFKNLDFEGSNFSHTNLNATSFEKVNLDNSNLSHADFWFANLYVVSFLNANFKETDFDATTFYEVRMHYEDYKLLTEKYNNLKLTNWNDKYNKRLNALGYFLYYFSDEESDIKYHKNLEYRNKDDKSVTIFDDGRTIIYTPQKNNMEHTNSIEKMFEILENEVKNNNENINKGSLHFKFLLM